MVSWNSIKDLIKKGKKQLNFEDMNKYGTRLATWLRLEDCENDYFISVQEKLREYEDAEEQGLLLRLPCKVRSTLYQPISNRINEYKVIDLCFDITRNKFMYEVAYQIGLEWYKTTCDFDCINKTVFLTQAEAEQKLKEMETNND